MKFLLFIGEAADGETYDPALDNIHEWVDDLDKRGARVLGDRLVGVPEAVEVRRRNGETSVSDGTATGLAATTSWIVGFDIVEAASRTEAIEIAAAHPMSRFGVVVIRELWGDRDW